MMKSQSRKLKVMEVGDYYKKTTVPKLLLQGKWLSQCGIKADTYVEITNPRPGMLVINLHPNTEGGKANQDT